MAFDINTILESTDLPEKARHEVPRVMNRLLGKTFLYQGHEADKEDYYLVHRHRDVFAALFTVAGFTLLHDDYHRIFQVVSDFGYCRQRYKLDESLMIVVLRKLYEEHIPRNSAWRRTRSSPSARFARSIAPSLAENAPWGLSGMKTSCAVCDAWA